jgi:hypothetical protein
VQAVSQVVLIDAQAYLDGVGPVSNAPKFVINLGVQFLRTKFLRNKANQMVYYDQEKLATSDAMRIGRLHTFCPGWLEAKCAFIKSGGYKKFGKHVRDPAFCWHFLWHVPGPHV